MGKVVPKKWLWMPWLQTNDCINWMNVGLSSTYNLTFIHLVERWMDELLYMGLDKDVHSHWYLLSPLSLWLALGFGAHFLFGILRLLARDCLVFAKKDCVVYSTITLCNLGCISELVLVSCFWEDKVLAMQKCVL